MMTFAIGGLQVWMPTFLVRMRHLQLDRGQPDLRRHDRGLGNGGARCWVAGSVIACCDARLRRINWFPRSAWRCRFRRSSSRFIWKGAAMYPAIFLGEFFLLLNTAPLNAALVNSVSARIRATALAVNVFTIHAARRRFLTHADRLYLRPQQPGDGIECDGGGRGAVSGGACSTACGSRRRSVRATSQELAGSQPRRLVRLAKSSHMR